MKKLVICFLFLLFCTGCDINYEIYYKNNNEIFENLDFSIVNSDALMYSDNVEEYIYNSFYAKRNSYNLKKYNLNIDEMENISKINLSKKHENLESLISNNIFDSIFSSKNMYESDDSTEIIFSGYKYGVTVNDGIFMDSETSDNLYITLRSNYRVITNADEVNNFIGVYKWKFDSESENKTIEIKFFDEINYIAYIYNLNPILLVFISIVLLLLLIYIMYILYKRRNYKINKI